MQKKPTVIYLLPQKNLLFVIDINDTTYVKVYNLKTYEFIRTFIKKGAGPNQQLDCHKLAFDKDLKYLYTTDLNKQKIFVYSLDDILNPSVAVVPVNDITLENHYLNRPLLLSNGKIVDYSNAKPGGKKSVFSFYSADGKFLSENGTFPQSETKYNREEQLTAYAGWVARSSDGNKIVISYFNTDCIDLYDTLGNLQRRIHGPDFFEPKVKTVTHFSGLAYAIVNDKDSHFAYSSAQMNNNELFVLYQGKDASKDLGYHKNTLFSFDNQLKPQTYFTLTQPIFAFDVDWDNHTLYGLTHQFNDNFIVQYNNMP